MADIEKIWYLILEGSTKGPFSFYELRANTKVTPDTLGWRDGMEEWKPLKEIPELARLFDEAAPLHEETVVSKSGKGLLDEGDLVVAADAEPPYWFLWALVALLVVLWIFISFWGDS